MIIVLKNTVTSDRFKHIEHKGFTEGHRENLCAINSFPRRSRWISGRDKSVLKNRTALADISYHNNDSLVFLAPTRNKLWKNLCVLCVSRRIGTSFARNNPLCPSVSVISVLKLTAPFDSISTTLNASRSVQVAQEGIPVVAQEGILLAHFAVASQQKTLCVSAKGLFQPFKGFEPLKG